LKKKLLIIGGSGLVGSTIIKYGIPEYEIFTTYNTNEVFWKNVESFKIDLLEDSSTLINLIRKIKPDFTIHTVAHASVDLCETNHKLADTLHVNVTKDIASVCKDVKSKLLYLSTDAVFEGKLGKKYTEENIPKPINYYGLTKVRAEKIILDSSPDNVILRTSVIYGWHKKSKFTNWILKDLMRNKEVDPFIDQYNTPTLVDDLVKSIIKIMISNVSGLYHATGKSCLNRYEFSLILAKIFRLNKDLIKPVTKLEKKQQAPRPENTCLDSKKLERLLNFNFCNIEKGVKFIYKKYKENPETLNEL